MQKLKEILHKGIDYHEIIECIVSALDAKDAYTAGHSKRVSDMAVKVCELAGIDKEETEQIHIAAHLHDIGKIGIPDAVLNKNGRLTDEEFECIKKHPVIGAQILSKTQHINKLKDMVLYHHERYDGRGYPQGLIENDIPLGARIIAVCDSIDAITSNRSYRKAKNFDFCYKEIKNNMGIMYDPDIGRCVIDNWQSVISASLNSQRV